MKGLGWKLVVLIVLAVLVFLWLIKAPILSSYLTDTLKVPVSIGSISIWPRRTTIKNFKVKNPRKYKTKYAFLADATEVEYRLGRLFATPSEIDEIEIENIKMNIELSNPQGTENNWTDIGNEAFGERKGKEVIVHRLVLTNLDVEIYGLGFPGSSQTKHVDRMEFDEIDSRNGFPTKEFIMQIFQGAGIEEFILNLTNPQNILQKVPLPFFGDKPPIQEK